jgi:hypothetical protein
MVSLSAIMAAEAVMPKMLKSSAATYTTPRATRYASIRATRTPTAVSGILPSRGARSTTLVKTPIFGAGSGILAKGYVQNAVIEYNYVHDTHGALLFLDSNETNHFGFGAD